MTDSAFLVVNQSGIARLRKTKPDLKSGERGVRIQVSMPDRYFDQPFPEAKIEMDEDDLIEPSASVQVETKKEELAESVVEGLLDLPEEEALDIVYRTEDLIDKNLGGLLREAYQQEGRLGVDLTELKSYPLDSLATVADWTEETR
jgi:hypothetical protein